MPKKRILFISGSLGLGHASRDLAIAKELRRHDPEINIVWLAAPPASSVLRKAGEKLLPEADLYANDTLIAEKSAKQGYRLNLLKYLFKAMGSWKQNVKIFERAAGNEKFDLIIADEAYEIYMALKKRKELRDRIAAPFVMIYDFVGDFSMSWNPVEKLGIYVWNGEWVKGILFYADKKNMALFVGEPEDVPQASLGFRRPTCREVAEKMCHFTGYVLPFDPLEYTDKEMIRKKLGYDQGSLVICSIGGTSVGKDLLSLCGKAYPIIKEQLPDLHMVLVCGPRLSADSLNVPKDVDVREYVPGLYEHFAACDLAIVQAGGTTTLELTALGRPFLYFPLEGHWEQQIHVASRLARHQAGIHMRYPDTTPDILAEAVLANISRDVTYPPIPADGAQKAAQLINQLL
jgi:UDP-N-acetylglucosamine:LPS N-acetylglucosamine transferase